MLTIVAFALCGCAEEQVEVTTPAPSAPAPQEPLVVALSAAFVSQSGTERFAELVEYVSDQSGIPLELVSGFAYETIDAMAADGAVDVAFVCGYPYVLGHDRERPIYELLVAPVMAAPRYGDRPVYYSDLIVAADSPYRSLRDLAGATYVYNEESSNSGFVQPRAHLVRLGLADADGYFGRVRRSGSHEESIRMVAAGEADASFVDSLVLEFDRDHGFGRARDVRVIESIGPFPIPPVVVNTRLPEQTRERLRAAFLDMSQDPKGRALLDGVGVARFEVVDDARYDDIRAAAALAERAGVETIR